MKSSALPFAALAIALADLGCTDVDHFSTAPDESYCGAITLAGAFRTGLSPEVQMRLTLDASELDGSKSPGKIWTLEKNRHNRRLLDGASLRRIPHLENDPLSRLQFGDGREENRIFMVTPAEDDADPILAILSLRSDANVEVRLLRAGLSGTGDQAPPSGKRALFGIFTLSRQAGSCGF